MVHRSMKKVGEWRKRVAVRERHEIVKSYELKRKEGKWGNVVETKNTIPYIKKDMLKEKQLVH